PGRSMISVDLYAQSVLCLKLPAMICVLCLLCVNHLWHLSSLTIRHSWIVRLLITGIYLKEICITAHSTDSRMQMAISTMITSQHPVHGSLASRSIWKLSFYHLTIAKCQALTCFTRSRHMKRSYMYAIQ